ncbi:MAG: hypothetical protein AB7F59_11330 [Bdellovibrionales bacterium]
MQLNELLTVIKHIKLAQSVDKLPDLYNQLATKLNEVRQNPSTAASESISTLKSNITKYHNTVEPVGWGFVRRQLLEKIGAKQHIGLHALKKFNQIFVKHQADPGGAASEVSKLAQEVKALFNRINQLETGLGELVRDVEEPQVPSGYSVVQVTFKEEASVDTLVDLRKVSEEWNKAATAFIRITGETVEEPKILSVEQGSLLIEFLLPSGTAACMALAIRQLLAVYEKVLDLKKKALEIENLKLKNKKLAQDIQTEAEAQITSAAEHISDEILENCNSKNSNQPNNEDRNAVQKALEQIFKFIEKGGEVDFWKPREETDGSPEKEADLLEAFSQVRQIEDRVIRLRLLEGGKSKSSEDDERKDQ